MTTSPPYPTGLRLLKTLQAPQESINRLNFSPDGQYLASSSFDGKIILWELATGQPQQQLTITPGYPRVIRFSPDGNYLAVGCSHKVIQLWQQGQLVQILEGHLASLNTLSWSEDSQYLASGSDEGGLIIWNSHHWQPHQHLSAHTRSVNTVEFSPHHPLLVSGSDDKLIHIWNYATGQLQSTLKGHSGMVLSLIFSPQNPNWLLSASGDKTIRLWDLENYRQIRVLEGHTEVIYKLSFSHDGQLFASKSDDDTVRLWRGDASGLLAVLEESTEHQLWLGGLCFHPRQPLLATLGEHDRIIRLWELDIDCLLAQSLQKPSLTKRLTRWFEHKRSPPKEMPNSTQSPMPYPPETTVHYTTAKIALVGDSGVGKTGLGWRIAHGYFKEQASTHGQQFWVIKDLGATRSDGTECEAVLWDLAGQPDYRLIHALFLDDVDLALIVFDPTHQQEPLKGVEYWLNQLTHHCALNRTCQKILVGARLDRGSPTLTNNELQQFCQHHDITNSYLLTSALTGENLPLLLENIRQAIRWNDMTTTVTTLTFKRIKEFVLRLKEQSGKTEVLLTPQELRNFLQKTDANWLFTDAELMTALQHLANHGYVSLLRTSTGQAMVLLFPDLLTNLASSLVLEARRNEKGLGALEETRLLRGDYVIPEIEQLANKKRIILETLIDAVLVLFLEHTICFRETIQGRTFLVFPALINQKRPALDKVPVKDDMSYVIKGAIENIYASLVVLLGYTETFSRIEHWQNQAQYQIDTYEICGFRKIEEREGELELVLYFGQGTQESSKVLFRNLITRFLQGREVQITAYSPLICTTCSYQQERGEVTKRLKSQKDFMFCGDCGSKIMLSSVPEYPLSQQNREYLDYEQSQALNRTRFAKALVWLKGYLRNLEKPVPSCFISYAWGITEHERWVRKLAEDMWDAGIEVILDDWDNSSIGSSVPRFISRLETCHFIVVIGTPLFLEKYQNKVSATGSVVAAEVDLIAQRLIRTEQEKSTVLPTLLEGDDRSALPALLRGRAYADFREKRFYFSRLFDLILTIYQIDFRDSAIRDLREALRLESQRQFPKECPS